MYTCLLIITYWVNIPSDQITFVQVEQEVLSSERHDAGFRRAAWQCGNFVGLQASTGNDVATVKCLTLQEDAVPFLYAYNHSYKLKDQPIPPSLSLFGII